MNLEARRMLALLEEELEAARRADTEALVRLQAEKRLVVERLRAEVTPDDVLADIQKKAQRNIQLIQHLASCLRSIAHEAAPVASYTPSGSRVDPNALTHTRGWL